MNWLPNSKTIVPPDFEPRPCTCPVEPVTRPPFYNHLGSGPDVKQLRESLEKRFNVTGHALRIEKVRYTCEEGKNREGCPVAKWVLRRQDVDEKILVVVRERPGHLCEDKVIVISIVVWEGFERSKASYLYQRLTSLLSEHATMVTRRCGTNETKNCCCQGDNADTCGASFSFGCSWSMFYNGCKFGNSTSPRKFKIQETEKEAEVKLLLESLATEFGPKCKMFAPKAYYNMTYYDSIASQCRMGKGEGRPFSGLTCCLDFCAHSHKDLHNMNHGTTMVLTLLKKGSTRSVGNTADWNVQGGGQENHKNEDDDCDDEQLHVLPMYQLLNDDDTVCATNYATPIHTLKSKIVPREPNLKRPSKAKRKPNRSKGDNENGKYRNTTNTTLESLNRISSLNEVGRTATEDCKWPIVDANRLAGSLDCTLLSNSQPWVTDENLTGENTVDEISYVHESQIPSVFSHPLHNVKKVSRKMQMKAGKVSHAQPRVRSINECQPVMFRQQHPQPCTLRVFSGDSAKLDELKTGTFHNLKDAFSSRHLETNELYLSELETNVCSNSKDLANNNFAATQQTVFDDFVTEAMGGVGIALTHGSVLIECAKKELHATTALKNPQRQNPTRLSIIFYQHKQLNLPNHGYYENKKKMSDRQRKRNAQDMKPAVSLKKGRAGVAVPLYDLQLLAEAAFSESLNHGNRATYDQRLTQQLPWEIGNSQTPNLCSTSPHSFDSTKNAVEPPLPTLPFQMETASYSNPCSNAMRAFDVVGALKLRGHQQPSMRNQSHPRSTSHHDQQNTFNGPILTPTLQGIPKGSRGDIVHSGLFHFNQSAHSSVYRSDARDVFKSSFSITSLLGLEETDGNSASFLATAPVQPPLWNAANQGRFLEKLSNGPNDVSNGHNDVSNGHDNVSNGRNNVSNGRNNASNGPNGVEVTHQAVHNACFKSERCLDNNKTHLWQVSNQFDGFEQQLFDECINYERDRHLLKSANKILLSDNVTANGSELNRFFNHANTDVLHQRGLRVNDTGPTSHVSISNRVWSNTLSREAWSFASNNNLTYAVNEKDNGLGFAGINMHHKNSVTVDRSNENLNFNTTHFQPDWNSYYSF
ncbi:methylcytosine dioxygenase TET1-like isoform X2 [Rhopilema esculentum]|uniref:methylcytosine dioxygenase TET1-like isoform X2 n=1 Tax=Rhopilema esculentum TaxID=499914 RepID=UPI0031E3B1F3